MNQFLITAAAEKLSSLGTVDYLRARAERADLDAFDRIMKKIPSGPPDPGDELPPKSKRRRGGLDTQRSGQSRARTKPPGSSGETTTVRRS